MPDIDVGEAALNLPRCVFIEVTNRCNLRCRTCPRTFDALEAPHTLSWEQFCHITDQFPQMARAVLHGIGEPLMNPELPRMVARLKHLGVTVLFNSNGTMLTEEIGSALIDAGLDELRVSIDAANSDTYIRIRGKPLLDHVIAKLRRFVSLQRAREALTPKLSLWLTGTLENVTELSALVELAGRIGIPEVYLQRLVYFLDSPNPPGLMSAGRSLSFDDPRVEIAILAAEEKGRELGVALHASGATDPKHSLTLQDQGARPWLRCVRPWTTAYVTANGNCLPCCMGPFATVDYSSLRMGNLFDQEFANIWNGPDYRSWRRAMLEGTAPIPCTGCGTQWSL